MGRKKLTINQLISHAQAEEKSGARGVDVYVPGLGGEIECREMPIDDVLDLMDRYGTSETRQSLEFQRELIYMACPIFHDEELQKQVGASDPVDVVKKVLRNNFENYSALTSAILSLNGLGEAKEKVKN